MGNRVRFLRLMRVALLAMATPAVPSVVAQEYPSKPVRIIVPYTPGGSTDVISRKVAQRLSETLGQNFIVDYRPGATGSIAGAFVARSAPDGYTLIMHTTSTYNAGFLYRDLSYDGASAFAPVIRVAISGLVMVSAASLPVRDIEGLIALARQRPNEVAFSTAGRGSVGHIAIELFNSATGIRTVAVHYKGAAPSLIGLASGEVSFSVLNILDPQPFIKQGRLRALATTGARRSSVFPNVPTLIESGINIEANMWTGLFATGKTPAAIVGKLNAEVARFLSEPQTSEWLLNNYGSEFLPHTPEQFSEFLTNDIQTWLKVIKQMDLHLD